MPTRNTLSPLTGTYLERCFKPEQRSSNKFDCLDYFILWRLWRLNSHSAWISSEGNGQLTICLAASLKWLAPLMTESVIRQDLGQFLSRPLLFWDVTWRSLAADYQLSSWTAWPLNIRRRGYLCCVTCRKSKGLYCIAEGAWIISCLSIVTNIFPPTFILYSILSSEWTVSKSLRLYVPCIIFQCVDKPTICINS